MFRAKEVKQRLFVFLLIAFSLLVIGCAETIPPGGISTSTDFDQEKYNAADELRGGRLYDNWWETKSIATPPAGSNPIWEAVTARYPNNTSGNDGGQWRCKTCHGWDYKGVKGAYNNQASGDYTGIRGLNNQNPDVTPEHIFDMIVDGSVQYIDDGTVIEANFMTHKFVASDKMDANDAYDLAKFVYERARVDTISPLSGNITTGEQVFKQVPPTNFFSCMDSRCHAETPANTSFAPPSLGQIIDIAQEDPAEFLHKVRFGAPEGSMPAGMDDNSAAHVYAFVQNGAILTTDPGTGNNQSDFNQATYNALTANAVVDGGQLYDKFWDVSSATEPAGNHPLWPASNTAITNSGTWRCKECHGWDYRGADGAYKTGKHQTDIKGIINTTNFTMQMTTAKDVYDFLKTDTNHAFHDIFTDAASTEYYNLTKFVMTMREEANATQSAFNFIDDGTKLTKTGVANADNGKTLYDTNSNASCGNGACHGEDGKAIDFDDGDNSTLPNEFVHTIALSNPWEFVHKVRFGQPDYQPMPALHQSTDVSVNTIDAAIDILAHSQTNLVTNIPSDFDQAVYDALGNADVAFGGQLYDKWWKVAANAIEPVGDHSQWPAANTQVSGSGTWRCKECHGWDYRGADGAYASGKHFTGIQGVVNTNGFTMQYPTAENVYAFIKEDANHGFANLFELSEYYALTKFIMTMRAETAAGQAGVDFINDTTRLAVDADALNGKTLYETANNPTCSAANCHDVDGKGIEFGDGDVATLPNTWVHNIAQENPWEFLHKIRFGQPDTAMPSLFDSIDVTANTIDAAVDILAYSQTNLVPSIKRAGRLYDKWWNVAGVLDPNVPATRNQTWVDSQGTTDPTQVSDSSTWRCKECHGWDYQGVHGAYGDTTSKHYSGIRGFLFPGIPARAQIIDMVTNGSAVYPDHDFGRFLSAQDIELIADFFTDPIQGIVDSDLLYDGYLANGNATAGKELYDGASPGNCLACHGDTGSSIPTVDVGGLANDNPEEFFHKIRYGHPGSIMVPTSSGFTGLTLDAASDVLAYSKTLAGGTDPGPGPDPGTFNYQNADKIRGGRLYDKWWKEMETTDASVAAPTAINPLWNDRNPSVPDFPATYSDAKKIETSWRCKNCHAWDYKGIGFYSGAKDSSGSDNLLYKIQLRRSNPVFAADPTKLQDHVYNWIKSGINGTHKFGEATAELPSIMGDRELWDLAKFLLEDGIIDTDIYLIQGKVISGVTDEVNGNGLYNGSIDAAVNCSTCHGADGATPPPIATGGSGDPLDIFAIASPGDNPWEFIHKTRFGQPGSDMPALLGIGTFTDQDAYDILDYAQKQFNAN